MMDCFQWQSWLMAFHSSYCTSVLQHGSRVSCHWEKGMWSNTFPFSVCDLQNIANRLLATNKKSLNNKVRARPATQYKQVASSMGNVGGWIQDYLEGGKKKKSRWFTNTPFQITVLQTAMWGRKCTVLHQLHWIPHHADTLRLWRERVSLLSAKRLLQNSAKAFRLNTGEISAVGYSTATGWEEGKKANHHQKKEPETMEFIWHHAIR